MTKSFFMNEVSENHQNSLVASYASTIDSIIAETERLPYFVTTSFTPIDADLNAKIDHCFTSYEKFYRHLTSRLMTNYTRESKFHLHPITFDFVDFPNTRDNRPHTNEPETPHIHSVFLIHPVTQSKFESLMSQNFSEIVNHDAMSSVIQCYALPITHKLPHLVSYASKFVQLSQSRNLTLPDLTTQYPIAKSELASRRSRKDKVRVDPLRMIRNTPKRDFQTLQRASSSHAYSATQKSHPRIHDAPAFPDA